MAWPLTYADHLLRRRTDTLFSAIVGVRLPALRYRSESRLEAVHDLAAQP